MAEFKLTLDQEKVLFSGKLGAEAATCNVKLTNPLKERVVYKIKCTSNEMFRIRPPVGELKKDESVSVSLIFNEGKTVPESGKHFFAFYYLKNEDEKKTPRAIWSDYKGEPEAPVKKLFVDFKKEGGDEKKEDKKDEKKEEKKDEKKKDDKKEEDGDEKKDKK